MFLRDLRLNLTLLVHHPPFQVLIDQYVCFGHLPQQNRAKMSYSCEIFVFLGFNDIIMTLSRHHHDVMDDMEKCDRQTHRMTDSVTMA